MKIAKQIVLVALTAFILHIIWENAQAPLFDGYISFSQHFYACLIGTFGDVVITLSVYAAIALLKNDPNWIATMNKKDIAVIAAIGLFIALGIEWRALFSGRWAYAEAMPLVPYLKAGILPVIQMTVLLPLSFFIVRRSARGR